MRRPIDRLHDYLLTKVLPKSEAGQAIAYTAELDGADSLLLRRRSVHR